MNTLFPIFIKADQVDILMVGGGAIAEEKLFFLLKSSPHAKVKLVAREVTDEVRQIAERSTAVQIHVRDFKDSDLNGIHFVIAATNNSELNDHIKCLANSKSILLNVADKSTLCDFYLGGVVTKGDLKLAISTNGKSPVMAKRLRQFFEAELPESLDEVIHELQELRLKLNGSFNKKLERLNALTKELIEQQ
jgi:siroheme synthase-like protein